jgi:hypothetical protein
MEFALITCWHRHSKAENNPWILRRHAIEPRLICSLRAGLYFAAARCPLH